MNDLFVRTRSVKDLVISTLLLVGGCVMVALPTPSAVNITGFFLCIAGIILFFILKTGWKHVETSEKYRCCTLYFAKENFSMLKEALEKNPEAIVLDKEGMANTVRLDIYYNKELNKTYCQLSEYVSYEYQPCSKVYTYDYNRIAKAIK